MADGATQRVTAAIERLEALVRVFGPDAVREKRRLLEGMGRTRVRRGRELLRLHEALCFLRAHPDDAGIAARADALLGGFARRAAALAPREARVLAETGVAGSTVYCPLGFAAAAWLVRRFPGAVTLDGDDPDTGIALGALLPLVAPSLAELSLVEAGQDPWAWLRAIRHGGVPADTAWLLDRIARQRDGRARVLYDQLQPRLAWRLGSGAGSRTLARVPGRRPSPVTGGLRRDGTPAERRLPGPPVPARPARPREATALVDAARAAVTVRYRELHAFDHADPSDVVVADLGRGAEAAWMGVRPAARLPIRAHYGYLLHRGGVPVGYGDASVLLGRCEIAFNVFEAYRQGESARLFLRLLGFLGRWLRVQTFVVSPYQIGAGNEEALGSGAFWFYWKLGFRPLDRAPAALARTERRRLGRAPGSRTPWETLARLAAGPMVLTVGPPGRRADPAGVDVATLARRAAGVDADPAALAFTLGARGWRAWPPAERMALERLAPLLRLLPALERWPAPDRQALVAIVRAKGGRPEREYLARMAAHRRLRAALCRLGGA